MLPLSQYLQHNDSLRDTPTLEYAEGLLFATPETILVLGEERPA